MLDAGCGPKICSISKIPENITAIGLDINRDNIYSSHKKAKDKGYKNFHFLVASIRLMKPQEYGVYSIALIPSYMAVLFRDWGVNSTITKYTASLRAENKEEQAYKNQIHLEKD